MKYVAALALLILLAACGGSGTDDDPVDPDHVFVQGSVTGLDGADVVVELMEEADDAEVGDTVETFELARARVGDDGSFAVAVDPDEEVPAPFRPEGAFWNFTLYVERGSSLEGLTHSTAWLVGTGADAAWRASERADVPLRIDVDFDAGVTTVDQGDGEPQEYDLVRLTG